MNNKHSVILLITLCISKSQIVVHGPPFRFTEDFWWSMEKLAGIMRRAPPLCCKLLRQVPMFFIITKDWRPLKAAGSFKKKQNKNQTKPKSMLPPLWKQGTQKRWSAKTSAPSRNILPPRWFPILCYFCTAQFKAGLHCSSLPTQRKAVPTIYNLPAAQGPLLRELWADGNANATGSKAPLQRKQLLCKVPYAGLGSVP